MILLSFFAETRWPTPIWFRRFNFMVVFVVMVDDFVIIPLVLENQCGDRTNGYSDPEPFPSAIRRYNFLRSR
jgi:hypothetical protein